MAVAVSWASHVTSIAMEMVVPALIGLWLDRKLETRFIFVTIGAMLGLAVGMMSLIHISRAGGGGSITGGREERGPPERPHDQ